MKHLVRVGRSRGAAPRTSGAGRCRRRAWPRRPARDAACARLRGWSARSSAGAVGVDHAAAGVGRAPTGAGASTSVGRVCHVPASASASQRGAGVGQHRHVGAHDAAERLWVDVDVHDARARREVAGRGRRRDRRSACPTPMIRSAWCMARLACDACRACRPCPATAGAARERRPGRAASCRPGTPLASAKRSSSCAAPAIATPWPTSRTGRSAASGAARRPARGRTRRRPSSGLCLRRLSRQQVRQDAAGDLDVGQLHVLGEIDQHRAGSAFGGEAERFGEDVRDLVGRRQLEGGLGDRPDHADDVDFLERLGADGGAGDLAGQGDDGHAVHEGGGQAGQQVGGAGAAGRHADADAGRWRARSRRRRGRRSARGAPARGAAAGSAPSSR